MDAVLHRCGLAAATVLDVAARHPGVRGLRVMRVVAALADPRAESPPESVVRVAITLSGLPAPVPQHVVLDRGRFVARADLAWPDLLLVAEYDGGHHNEARQFSRDRLRATRIVCAGWRYIGLDATHLRAPRSLIDTVGRAVILARADRARRVEP